MADASIFQRATLACMEGRGYTRQVSGRVRAGAARRGARVGRVTDCAAARAVAPRRLRKISPPLPKIAVQRAPARPRREFAGNAPALGVGMTATTPEEPFEKTFRLVCRLDDADIDYVRDTAEWIRRCVARVLARQPDGDAPTT